MARMLVFMRTKEENFAKYHQYNGDEITSIFDVLTTKMEVISIIVYIVFLLWIMDATKEFHLMGIYSVNEP